jgi:hypothetical protein
MCFIKLKNSALEAKEGEVNIKIGGGKGLFV